MPRLPLSRPALLLGALALAACSDSVAAPSGPDAARSPALARGADRGADRSAAVVRWHAQQAMFGRSGIVAGADAHLVRTANGIAFQLQAADLTPGNAYTLWLVVVNRPAACANVPCTAPDLFNPATHTQVRFAAGHVAGASGRGTFAGSVQEGALTGWLADRTFADAGAVEVHLVVNDHGPMLPDHMPGMIHTYRGGCADTSPFPAIFPPTARADGEPGPNTCRLYQAAIFTAP